MILARVLGSVVATAKHPVLAGDTLLLVIPVDERGRPAGAEFIAVDHAQAGAGDLVLVLREGNGARQLLGRRNAPIRSLIVGVVDAVESRNAGVVTSLAGASSGSGA
jgi:ethanolamine utilization protein EutN